MKYLITLLVVIFFIQACVRIPEFNQERSYSFLETQCEFGPRYPGSDEIKLCRDYIVQKLTSLKADVVLQEFQVSLDDRDYTGINIIAGFYPQMGRRILLGAHYDTRPWADKEVADSSRSLPILGANDAASGVAVLLELAEAVSEYPPKEFGLDLVFFDLEDMGEYGNNRSWCLGSDHFVSNYSGKKPEKVIIIDMVGDRNLSLPMEYYSYHNSPNLVNEVWEIGKTLGFREFQTRLGPRIYDDHMPFVLAGFNAIDIIDFDYPYWHTLADTPDKCDPNSLYIVGQTLLTLIYSD